MFRHLKPLHLHVFQKNNLNPRSKEAWQEYLNGEDKLSQRTVYKIPAGHYK